MLFRRLLAIALSAVCCCSQWTEDTSVGSGKEFIYQQMFVHHLLYIVVCTLCCCMLNYYRPHRNPIVFWIDEVCALLTTGKYLVTVFGNSVGDDVSVKVVSKTDNI